MKSMLRQFRRAPGRIAASVLALALAIGAIGVLAVPAVSEGTLHEAVGRDGLGDIIVAIDGRPIVSKTDFDRVMDGYDIGDTVAVTLERDGDRREVSIELEGTGG